MIFLNSPLLYLHFENELRKSACLSFFLDGISRFWDSSQLLPRLSWMGYQGFVVKRVGFTNLARSKAKKQTIWNLLYTYIVCWQNQKTLYNIHIIHWFAGPIGQRKCQSSVWCSKYFLFIIYFLAKFFAIFM